MFHAHPSGQAGALLALVLACASGTATFGQEPFTAQDDPAVALPTLLPERLREEALGYKVIVNTGGTEMSGEAEASLAKTWIESDAGRRQGWRFEYRELGSVTQGTTLVLGADLELLERHIVFPTGNFTLLFSDDSVGINMIGSADAPDERPLPMPVLANWDVAVLALPLVEGFETTARTFELMQDTVRWNVTVLATETVEVPAGQFESYKVALTCLDNDAFSATVWVSKEAPFRIVRRESLHFPQMGMASGNAVIELARIGAPPSND